MTHTDNIYSGTIIKGLQNGRKFGFPTANIELAEGLLPPETGINAVKVWLEKQSLFGMLYVGTRPTLQLDKLSIEIHLFNFQEDIYGKQLQFEILKKIREEKTFDSPQQLIDQLRLDKQHIIRLLNE